MTAMSHAHVVSENFEFARVHLPRLRCPSGLYCYDRTFGSDRLRGESVRYSLMVALGLQRARAGGITDLPDDPEELLARCLGHRDELTPGDLGLALWADSRAGGGEAPALLARLESAISSEAALASLVGMEVAWITIGLAETVAQCPTAEPLLNRTIDHLRRARRAKSGFYYHDASTSLRRHLPNFATEIYTLLALTTLARNGLDDRSLTEAEQLAEGLVRLQLPDGGWPWLFDAERASVVERYEIYSVHQDAMAPMALLALAEVTGEERWRLAAIRGLAWSRGQNELGVDFFDDAHGFVHRSIRRRPPWDRVALATASVSSRVLGRARTVHSGTVEVNPTCRPYHLGWILEAWAGTPSVADALDD